MFYAVDIVHHPNWESLTLHRANKQVGGTQRTLEPPEDNAWREDQGTQELLETAKIRVPNLKLKIGHQMFSNHGEPPCYV